MLSHETNPVESSTKPQFPSVDVQEEMVERYLEGVKVQPFGCYWKFVDATGHTFAHVVPCAQATQRAPIAFVFNKQIGMFELLSIAIGTPYYHMHFTDNRAVRVDILTPLLYLLRDELIVIASGMRGTRLQADFHRDSQRLAGFTWGIGKEIIGAAYTRVEKEGFAAGFAGTDYHISNPKRYDWYRHLESTMKEASDFDCDATDPEDNGYWTMMISALPSIEYQRKLVLGIIKPPSQ